MDKIKLDESTRHKLNYNLKKECEIQGVPYDPNVPVLNKTILFLVMRFLRCREEKGKWVE